MSKRKKYQDARRRIRRIIKNVENDVGNMTGHRIHNNYWGCGINRRSLAKNGR